MHDKLPSLPGGERGGVGKECNKQTNKQSMLKVTRKHPLAKTTQTMRCRYARTYVFSSTCDCLSPETFFYEKYVRLYILHAWKCESMLSKKMVTFSISDTSCCTQLLLFSRDRCVMKTLRLCHFHTPASLHVSASAGTGDMPRTRLLFKSM